MPSPSAAARARATATAVRPAARRRVITADDAVIAALWLSFAGLFLRAFGQSINVLRHGGRLCFDVCAVTLILAGLHRLLTGSQARHSGALYALVYALLGVSAAAAAVGVAYQNNMIAWVTMGFLPFVGGVAMLLGESPELFDRLIRVFMRQTYIGMLFTTYILIFDRPSSRGDWNGTYGDGIAKLAARSLYAVPFLLPYFASLSRTNTFLLVTAYFELILLHITGANRGPVIALVIVLPALLVIIVQRREGSPRSLLRLVQIAFLLLIIVAPLANLLALQNPDLGAYADDRFNETLTRMVGGDADEGLGDLSEGALETSKEEFTGTSSRGGELRDFISQLEPVDLIVGRGFGGTWISQFWGLEWSMVHIGPGHLVLVGGLPLLIVFLLIGWRALASGWRLLPTNIVAPGALIFMVLFLLGFVQHGAFQEDNELFVFWLCAGLLLATPQGSDQRVAGSHPGA